MPGWAVAEALTSYTTADAAADKPGAYLAAIAARTAKRGQAGLDLGPRKPPRGRRGRQDWDGWAAPPASAHGPGTVLRGVGRNRTEGRAA